MELKFHTLNTLNPTDLVNNPEDLQRVTITHDGESVSYFHDNYGWFTFGEYNTLFDIPCESIEVTAETVIAEIIRAIALSVEEPVLVQVWLS